MILDSITLTKAQKCPRIYILEQTESRGKWEPKALFDSCLRAGIGTSSASSAETVFRRNATKPGLSTKHDPWTISGDYCAMLHTILEAWNRKVTGELRPIDPIQFGNVYWQPLSFRSPNGILRVATVERFDEPSLWRELHGWGVFGDMAATGLDMDLILIEIGSIRMGRRHSPWCRSFKHPAINNFYRFKPKEGRGSALKGNWKPYWYADTHGQDPKVWVDLMEKDQVELFHMKHIPALGPAAKRLFQYQLGAAAERLMNLPKDFREAEMHKANCDWPTQCPWQHKCYPA